MASNKKLAKDIIDKWPLPKKEAIELARLVERAGGDTPIPLVEFSKIAVKIEDDGGFRVKFDIPYWAYQRNIDLRRGMVRMVNESFAGSSIWQVGSKDNLLFYSSIKHRVFARVGALSVEDRKYFKIPTKSELIYEKVAATMAQRVKQQNQNLPQEFVNDVANSVNAITTGIWEMLKENKGGVEKMPSGTRIISGMFHGIDVVFTTGKILIQGKGEFAEDIVVGEYASMILGWAAFKFGQRVVVSGATAITATVSATTIGVIAAVVGSAFVLMYIWYDWDQWIAQNAPKFWQKLKEGRGLEYLHEVQAIGKLKKLVSDWERDMKASLEEYLMPEFLTAFRRYKEVYELNKSGADFSGNDLLPAFIKKLLDGAGIPLFYQK